MSRDISLFSGYSQKENRTTNYCLLVLRMLYEENPKLLDEALDALTGGKTGDTVGVRFQQQRRRKGSVPDGVILQAPFALYIETKNFDWFHDGQLESHLDGLEGERGLRVLLALANFDSVGKSRFAHIEELCEVRRGHLRGLRRRRRPAGAAEEPRRYRRRLPRLPRRAEPPADVDPHAGRV